MTITALPIASVSNDGHNPFQCLQWVLCQFSSAAWHTSCLLMLYTAMCSTQWILQREGPCQMRSHHYITLTCYRLPAWDEGFHIRHKPSLGQSLSPCDIIYQRKQYQAMVKPSQDTYMHNIGAHLMDSTQVQQGIACQSSHSLSAWWQTYKTWSSLQLWYQIFNSVYIFTTTKDYKYNLFCLYRCNWSHNPWVCFCFFLQILMLHGLCCQQPFKTS